MSEYIEKQAAIDKIEKSFDRETILNRFVRKIAISAIRKMEPDYVRPIIDGNWIPVTNGRGGHECSRCHQYAPSYQAGNEYLSRFCPFCGCYMGEE